MMKYLYINLSAILSVLLILVVAVALCADRGGRRIAGSDRDSGFKSPCGSSKQVSKQVGACLDGLFELTEGKFSDPKDDNDIQGHCQRFNNTERCTRIIAKDCLTGLHKTAVSAVASSTRRYRLQECKSVQSRSRYYEALRCAMRRAPEMKALYQSNTGVLQGIRDMNITAEQKLIKLCCVLNRLDEEVVKIFDRDCPKSTGLVIGIIHALTDDARSTLCLNPKCEHALDQVMGFKYTPPQNFMEPTMEILFQLQVN